MHTTLATYVSRFVEKNERPDWSQPLGGGGAKVAEFSLPCASERVDSPSDSYGLVLLFAAEPHVVRNQKTISCPLKINSSRSGFLIPPHPSELIC